MDHYLYPPSPILRWGVIVYVAFHKGGGGGGGHIVFGVNPVGISVGVVIAFYHSSCEPTYTYYGE